MRSCGPTSGQLRPKSSRRRPIPARSLANICRISVATAKASVEAWPSLGPRPLRWKSPELARDRANMKQDSVESRHWAPIPPNLWRVRLTLGGCSSTMSPPFLSRTACRSRLRAPMLRLAPARPSNRTIRPNFNRLLKPYESAPLKDAPRSTRFARPAPACGRQTTPTCAPPEENCAHCSRPAPPPQWKTIGAAMPQTCWPPDSSTGPLPHVGRHALAPQGAGRCR